MWVSREEWERLNRRVTDALTQVEVLNCRLRDVRIPYADATTPFHPSFGKYKDVSLGVAVQLLLDKSGLKYHKDEIR